MSATTDLKSKTVIVVGAGGGVGAAAARKLVAAGYDVIATVSRPERIADVHRESPGCRQIVSLDLSDADEIATTLARVADEVQQLAAVVVCAADGPVFRPAEFMPLAAFRRAMEINCVSNLAIYQATMPALRRHTGRLVFVGSLSGRVGTPLMVGYVASKFALEGLVDVMRMEARKWNVEVVLLQPGSIDTKMASKSAGNVSAAMAEAVEQERALYNDLYKQTLGRVSAKTYVLPSPDSVADVVIEALVCERPESRYRVGRDAEYLIQASKTKTDREMDDIIAAAYRSRE